MDKPTFVHFTDAWGSMYVNVAEIIAMWPGPESETTCVQTTNTEKLIPLMDVLMTTLQK